MHRCHSQGCQRRRWWAATIAAISTARAVEELASPCSILSWIRRSTLELHSEPSDSVRHYQRLIEPGKPTQNAFVESFNARLRVMCVNEHVLRTEHASRGVVLASLSETRVEGGAHPLQDFGVAMEQIHDVRAGEHCTELEGELFGRLLRTELPELGGARRALPEQ